MAKTIYVVPGLMGSTLDGAAFPHLTYWVNYPALLAYGPQPFALAADGVSPLPPSGVALGVDGTYPFGTYDGLVARLGASGYGVKFFAYDWRLSVRGIAKELAKELLADRNADGFSLVAHSLGGLVALLAYVEYTAVKPATAWKSTVNVAVPFGGSYDSAAALSGVGNPFNDYALWFNTFGLLGKDLVSFFAGPVTLADRVYQVMASWPSLYELLPNPSGPWAGLDLNVSDFFKLANWENVNPYVTQVRLDDAETTQAAIVTAAAGFLPRSYYVVGYGLATADEYNSPQVFGTTGFLKTQNVGDHVVEEQRAQLSSTNLLRIFEDHQSLPNNADFLAELARMLDDSAALPKTDPQPLRPQIPLPPPMTTIEFPRPPFPSLVRRGDP